MHFANVALVAGFVASCSAVAVPKPDRSHEITLCVDADFQGNCANQAVAFQSCTPFSTFGPDFDNQVSSFGLSRTDTFCILFDDENCNLDQFLASVNPGEQIAFLDAANDRVSSFQCGLVGATAGPGGPSLGLGLN